MNTIKRCILGICFSFLCIGCSRGQSNGNQSTLLISEDVNTTSYSTILPAMGKPNKENLAIRKDIMLKLKLDPDIKYKIEVKFGNFNDLLTQLKMILPSRIKLINNTKKFITIEGFSLESSELVYILGWLKFKSKNRFKIKENMIVFY